jgi:uncharacterized protein (TIGR02145 family)
MKRFLKFTVIVFLSIGLAAIMLSCQKPTAPAVTTVSVSAITQTSATCGGNVTDDGGAEVTARGVCWGTSQNPTTGSSKTNDGTGTGTFTSSITGLTPGNEYFVRAYATNSEGTSYGGQESFSSNPVILATLATSVVTSVTSMGAVSGGTIISDGGAPISAKGICWAITADPTTSDNKTNDGIGTSSFISTITGLSEGTTYHVRAYAINSAGTAYGDDKSFTTEQLKDADGNVYTTITIGTQVWMVENLKTTKYNDGTAIPLVSDAGAWAVLNAPGYCWYNNDEAANKATYGALYHWLTGNTGKLCPTGWHVPTDSEWTTLTDYLGGESISGSKLKEAGTIHWLSPNTGATNESGFTALPGGFRAIDGTFNNIGSNGYWDSSTEYNASNRYGREMHNDGSDVIRGPYGKRRGLSVRCLKD